MFYSDILATFFKMFINYIEEVESWSPNGRRSIKLHLKSHQELVFTYNSERDWSLSAVPKRVRA